MPNSAVLGVSRRRPSRPAKCRRRNQRQRFKPGERTLALYPLVFQPLFKERVWGGRSLETLYHKPLPPGRPIGESWEIADRPEGVSVVINGPWAGQDLRWLMENHRTNLLGPVSARDVRFPLLVKILDARDTVSLQVHPPPAVAAQLGGEPKTELWYIAAAAPGAVLYVGLKRGMTRAEFERQWDNGTVAAAFHQIRVQAGDAMFLPSGRVHAIGAGTVIFEIQENSDTTYRVFDWNRLGLDGHPRPLHRREALASIDFDDWEPALVASPFQPGDPFAVRPLVRDPLFAVDVCPVEPGRRFDLSGRGPAVLGVVAGQMRLAGGGQEVRLEAGGFCLLPAALESAPAQTATGVTFLQAWPTAEKKICTPGGYRLD